MAPLMRPMYWMLHISRANSLASLFLSGEDPRYLGWETGLQPFCSVWPLLVAVCVVVPMFHHLHTELLHWQGRRPAHASRRSQACLDHPFTLQAALKFMALLKVLVYPSALSLASFRRAHARVEFRSMTTDFGFQIEARGWISSMRVMCMPTCNLLWEHKHMHGCRSNKQACMESSDRRTFSWSSMEYNASFFFIITTRSRYMHVKPAYILMSEPFFIS
jgi:hypothetical protein